MMSRLPFIPAWRSRTYLQALSLALTLFIVATPSLADGREKILFDSDWRFALGHPSDPSRDFGFATGYFSYLAKTGFADGPANPEFDDRTWRRLDLPHDWAAEAPFSPRGSHSHGYRALGPGFPERNIGWYRKQFFVPESDLGRRIAIEFEGIYRDARVFVNGFYVGNEPSGYLDQYYDVSEYLNYGGENVVVVRADASMEEGWYYEGAGIYRHVWLHKTDPLHVDRHGVWVRSEVEGQTATLHVESRLVNDGRQDVAYSYRLRVLDPAGTEVAAVDGDRQMLGAAEQRTTTNLLVVDRPRLWTLEDPALHTLVVEARSIDGHVVDRQEVPFGIRTIRFDPDRGFFLNGMHVKLKGTNNHQDHAGVGTAIPDALQEWRLRQLKAMGSNAYRASHHPASPALLDLCDRLGILVIDENRLMGISDVHFDQLERMMVRDRNHPSIILWSLGNEEWRIESNILGARITSRMQDIARRVDSTRIFTVGISGGWGGISTVVDAMGVNYIRHGNTDRQHTDHPWQVIVGTEETTTQATRGVYVEDRAAGHLAPLEDGSSGGNAEKGWQHYAARDYLAGIFYWTGFDYRGEPTPYAWPAVSSQFGILDAAGFPKDSFFYLQSWWTDQPVLHLFPHWNGLDNGGAPIEVRAHSNHDEVELFLNGRSLGRKSMPRNGHLAWMVPYQPGTLKAVGYRAGRKAQETQISTTGAPAAIRLVPDRTEIGTDGRDVAVVTVQVVDTRGRVVPTADTDVRFSLIGPGRILGVGNGDPSSHERDLFPDTVLVTPLDSWTVPDARDATTPVRWEVTFDAPRDSTAHLLLSTLGREQTVTLNGRVLMEKAAPGRSAVEVPYRDLSLEASGNRLVIEAVPFTDRSAREQLSQVHPAQWRVQKVSSRWHRRAFNGLAQILIQAGNQPGTLRLVATADGVEGTEVEVRMK